MSVPIANALFAIYKQEVRSEYLHPVLGAIKTGPGRRPEVDFAVIDRYPDLSCVVESKWLGPNGLTVEDILWDLLRLELITHTTKAPAFFLIGGRRKHLERFFQSKTFLGTANARGTLRRLLKLGAERQTRIRVDSPTLDRRDVFVKLLRPYQNLSFSCFVTTSSSFSYPQHCPNFQYQTFVWHVLAPQGTPRLFPRDHKLYCLDVEPEVSGRVGELSAPRARTP